MNNPITQADIAEALNKLGNSFDGLRQDINGINTTVQSIDKRLIAVENKLDGIDTRLSNVESSVQKIPDLSEKIGELKNCGATPRYALKDSLSVSEQYPLGRRKRADPASSEGTRECCPSKGTRTVETNRNNS